MILNVQYSNSGNQDTNHSPFTPGGILDLGFGLRSESQGVSKISFDFSLDHVPPSDQYYYWALQFWSTSQEGGYFGFQNNGNLLSAQRVGGLVNFAIWDALGAEAGPNGEVGTFGNEGSGFRAPSRFQMVSGTKYTFTLEKTGDIVSLHVRDKSSGISTLIGKIHSQDEALIQPNFVVFSEIYLDVPSGHDVFPVTAHWDEFRLDGGPVPIQWSNGRGIYHDPRSLDHNVNSLTSFNDSGISILTGGKTNHQVTTSEKNDEVWNSIVGNTVDLRGGNDIFVDGSGSSITIGGAGNDKIDGGSGLDTAVFAGIRSAYTITQGSIGVFTVTGPDGTDTLRNVEFAQFDNQTVRLLPGTGTTVNFASDNPASYMAAIRDFDGNDLGSSSGWTRIGQADVNGDGDTDQIFVNRDISRFAEVGTAPDGKVYFADHGWAGETRVVGIYVDPLVQSGEVTAGGPNDSQRRFQNDLAIGNIKGVLGGADYDHNGSQEVYFSLTDGTAYLHAYMHADGNIQYANYQSQAQVIDYLTQNGWAANTYAGWFG